MDTVLSGSMISPEGTLRPNIPWPASGMGGIRRFDADCMTLNNSRPCSRRIRLTSSCTLRPSRKWASRSTTPFAITTTTSLGRCRCCERWTQPARTESCSPPHAPPTASRRQNTSPSTRTRRRIQSIHMVPQSSSANGCCVISPRHTAGQIAHSRTPPSGTSMWLDVTEPTMSVRITGRNLT